MSKSKGITLIALVITIIVLLILAGISIATLTGENGLLTKANTAKTETKKANAEEQVKIAVAGSLDNEGKLTANRVKEELGKIPDVGDIRDTDGGFSIEVDLDGYTFVIDGNGNVTRKAVKPVVDYSLSTDKQVAEGTEVTVTITATIGEEETITKITKQGTVIATNTGTATFTVTTSGVYTVTAEGSNKEVTTIKIIIANIGTTEIFSDIYTATQTYTDKTGKTAKIPEGFAVGVSSTIDKIDNGLVITDEIDTNHKSIGNEFVWIPVNNASDFKRVEGYCNGSKQDWISSNNATEPYTNGSQTEKDLEKDMRDHVTDSNTKGFYIGRYEAGYEGENKDKKVVVKKNKPVYNKIPWSGSDTMTILTGGAVELSKNFIKDKKYKGKVTSTLVYGAQWDATLKFFNDTNYLKNSTGKGNYSQSLINTGSNENYKVKNIYDMAGNVNEWTMEACNTNSRSYRGGGFGSDGAQYPISYRYKHLPTASYPGVGFRVALYL